MKKRALSLVLALWMLLGLPTGALAAEAVDPPRDTGAAKIGDTPYATLAEAVSEAMASGGTVTLLRDVTESVTLEYGRLPVKKIYLELAGHTLTGDITVGKGVYLFVNESGDQTGKIDGGLTVSGANARIYLYGGHMPGTVTAGTGDTGGLVYIYGGYITGTAVKGAKGTLEYRGGRYPSDPSDHLASSGYCIQELEEPDAFGCRYQVVEDRVAQIVRDGETMVYKTVQDAYREVKAGETITLLKDVDLGTSSLTVGKAVTLDLGGHTVKGRATSTPCVFFVNMYNAPAIGVTVKNGTVEYTYPANSGSGSAILANYRVDVGLENVKVKATVADPSAGAMAYGVQIGKPNTGLGPKVTVQGAQTEITGTTAGIAIFNNNSENPDGPLSGTLTVEDGVITGGWYGIAGNGNCHNTSITVNGGTVRSTYPGGTGIFHPQKGELTVNGGTIEGGTGIEMRAGTLSVTGGAITGTAETFEAGGNESGNTVRGAGIAVSQHTTELPVSVTIRKGEGAAPVLSGQYALYERDVQDETALSAISIHIQGGEFTSTSTEADAKAVHSENVTGFISGGTFSTPVAPVYCAADYVPAVDADGRHTVARVAGDGDLSIDPAALALTVGGSGTLAAKADGTTVEAAWASGDPEVAAVDENGAVTAVKEGAAVITATVNGKTAACTVSVTRQAGSGGSGSGHTTAETVTNPDGSKTTTVTNKRTGTVTETTRRKDGSTLVVETGKDGAVTTTETRADRVKVKTVEEPGKEVTATVTIPRGVGSAAVTVPAEVTPGTVAVDAGTGEVVKLCVPTEKGLAVKLDGSAQLVLVDRSRDFDDIRGHWGKGGIDFAVARGMFYGTGETTFAPDSPMTRAMLMTVLARFDGQDTGGGATWYEKGMEWAVGSGVSDGADPGGLISREQLATMLYRYVGSPAGEGELDRFPDAGEVSGYAADAMRWAVGTGILVWMNDGTLAPQGSATRAQVATVFMRLCANLTK